MATVTIWRIGGYLKEGEVFVIDFAKNYNHQETEEPQSFGIACNL